MKIADAKFCANCDEIVDYNATECPKCLDRVLIPLIKFVAPINSIAEMAKKKYGKAA
jgi:hypothetical protein